MTNNRNRWTNSDGLEMVERDHRQYDPSLSYGIIKNAYPTDELYRLTYDSDLRYLKLNNFTFQTFQFESNADRVFNMLFKQDGDIKTITVSVPAKADVIVNNISMPLKLRNALFTTGSKGTRLQVHTIISRERALKFGVNIEEVDDFIIKSRDIHYKLIDANKRK